MHLLRYWYYLVPPAYLAVILWLQPGDRPVMITAEPPEYPLRGSTCRLLTDDADTLAYVIRAENAARGRKAGVVGPQWFHKATGLQGYDPKHPDEYEQRVAPYEPFRPGRPLERYFLEYPPLALYMFRLGLVGAPPVEGEGHPALLDEHQFYVGSHTPDPTKPGEVALYKRFRHAMRVYAVLMTLVQLGLMALLDFGWAAGRAFPVPTWLLILPGFLYYTPCRFDVLPAALVIAAIAASDRRRVLVSGVLFGLAVALKMYPLVLGPIVLRFTARSWKDVFIWCGAGAVPVALSYGLMYLTDGWLGATVPLRFQLARDPEPVWCFYDRFIPIRLADKTPVGSLFRMGVPLIVSLACSVRRPPDVFSLLRRCSIALIVFLSLSVFYSPQWWQWLAVLLVPLAGRHRWLVGWVAALDLWTFLHFPLLFDSLSLLGDSGPWLVDLHVLVRAQLWFVVAAVFAWIEVWNPRVEPGTE